MKSVAVAFVVMAVSQTLALPTNGNGAEIVFSEDRNVYPANGADGHKIDFLQQNDAETLEEALYTYTELLKGLKQQKSGIRHPPQVINDQPDRTNDVANDQTTALCTEPACDCTQLKKGFFEGTAPNGDTCTVFNVPYCEGVCYARHKYKAVEDQPGAEPISDESYKCCMLSGTTQDSFYTLCKDSNDDYYSFDQTYTVATACHCSSAGACRH